jgi:type IV pilus assembly protein PilY1
VANDKWAVIIGNGYNNTEADGHASTTGHAYLYILFIEEGIDGTWNTADYVKIDTGEGSVGIPNGLATPAPIDADGDGDIDRIYAGDLLGNLWAFDVSDVR